MTPTLGQELRSANGEPSFPPEEIQRVEHSRLRRRLLYGLAREDFRAKVRHRLRSIERADAWGEPDCTGNLFAPACRTLAQLYTPDPPRVKGPVSGDPVIEAATRGGLWSLLVRGQRDTIGMREWLVRVEAVVDPGALLGWSLAYRPVYADRVVARPRPDAPDLPGYIAEAVYLARVGDPVPRWYWEVWDITGPVPYYELRTDLSPHTSPTERLEGPEYPHWDRSRPKHVPVLPYSLYHAERTGYLWDPWEWLEAVEASLEIVCQLTFFSHVILKAAWPQRYSIGVDWGGSTLEEDNDGNATTRPVQAIPSDPAMVLVGYPSEDSSGALTGQPMVDQWQLSADPLKVIEAIGMYERRAAITMGMNAGQIQRTSGDPRSGYALQINKDDEKEARDRFLPQFSRADTETLRVSAVVLGNAAGVVLATEGYSQKYGPLDVEEIVEAYLAGKMSFAAAVSRLIKDHGMSGTDARAVLDVNGGHSGGRDTRGSGGPDQGAGDGAGRGQGGSSGAPSSDSGDGGGYGPDSGESTEV